MTRLARHLAGSERLASEAAARADIDGNGTPDAADLLALLRLARSTVTMPVPVPRLDGLDPTLARVGSVLTLLGSQFGDDAAALLVGVEMDGPSIAVPVLTATDDRLTFTVPVGTAPGNARLRVLRQGIASNALALSIVDGPALEDVDPPAASASATVRIRGSGFGSDPGLVGVRFGGVDATVVAVSDRAIEARVPGTYPARGRVTVVIDGRESNGVPFTLVKRLAGRVALPPGSAALASVATANGEAVPDAGGTFAVAADAAGCVVSALLADGRMSLQAWVSASEANPTVDALSTAVALVATYRFWGTRSETESQPLLVAARSAPEVGALAATIAAGHPARPALADLIAHDDGVRVALRNALISALAIEGIL